MYFNRIDAIIVYYIIYFINHIKNIKKSRLTTYHAYNVSVQAERPYEYIILLMIKSCNGNNKIEEDL